MRPAPVNPRRPRTQRSSRVPGDLSSSCAASPAVADPQETAAPPPDQPRLHLYSCAADTFSPRLPYTARQTLPAPCLLAPPTVPLPARPGAAAARRSALPPRPSTPVPPRAPATCPSVARHPLSSPGTLRAGVILASPQLAAHCSCMWAACESVDASRRRRRVQEAGVVCVASRTHVRVALRAAAPIPTTPRPAPRSALPPPCVAAVCSGGTFSRRPSPIMHLPMHSLHVICTSASQCNSPAACTRTRPHPDLNRCILMHAAVA